MARNIYYVNIPYGTRGVETIEEHTREEFENGIKGEQFKTWNSYLRHIMKEHRMVYDRVWLSTRCDKTWKDKSLK